MYFKMFYLFVNEINIMVAVSLFDFKAQNVDSVELNLSWTFFLILTFDF